METIFDIVPNLQASTLDSTQLEQLCKEQQSITFDRIAKWLTGHSRIFVHQGEFQFSKHIENISEEMELFRELALEDD